MRKISLRDIIESVDNPELEESWTKLPTHKPVVVSTERKENQVISKSDYFGIISIHTHPSRNPRSRYPSYQDYLCFLTSGNRSTVVAQTDPKTGELIGYSIVKKGKKLHRSNLLFSLVVGSLDFSITRGIFGSTLNKLTSGRYFDDYAFAREFLNWDSNYNEETSQKDLKDFLSRYNLKYRYVTNDNPELGIKRQVGWSK